MQSQLVEQNSHLERQVSSLKAAESQQLADTNAMHADAERRAQAAEEAARQATLDAQTRLAQSAGEHAAMSAELSQLKAEQRAAFAQHATELAEARSVKEAELSAVEARSHSP